MFCHELLFWLSDMEADNENHQTNIVESDNDACGHECDHMATLMDPLRRVKIALMMMIMIFSKEMLAGFLDF